MQKVVTKIIKIYHLQNKYLKKNRNIVAHNVTSIRESVRVIKTTSYYNTAVILYQ